MKFLKKNSRMILFFMILSMGFLLSNVFRYHYDATWEYGMSHAIRMGEVPYRDFNTISTPLFFFLFSIGLFIYDSFWTFLLEIFVIEIVVFYFVDKAYEKNSLFYIFSICFLSYFALIPSYNLLAFLIIILLLSFEKLEYSDRLIGFFWGLLILAKHTIGLPVVFFVMIGLLIQKYDIHKLFQRILFMMIPLCVFLIYLLVFHSFYQFFDLCFMGLFDFASKNTVSTYIIFAIILFLYSVYALIKHKKEISFYYMLSSIVFLVPVFDLSHISFYFSILILVSFGNKEHSFLLSRILVGMILFFACLGVVVNITKYQTLAFASFPHYQGVPFKKEIIQYNQSLDKHLSSYDHYYVIDGFNMFYDITHDRKITYYNVPLHGNYGYNGNHKLLERIESEEDCYFIIMDHAEDYNIDQFAIEAVDYIQEHYELVDSFDCFLVYYKE